MNPLVPSPDAIPAPWGYFQLLLMLTFALHLLLMNALLGSTGIALYAHLRGGETHRRLAGELSKVLPFLVAFTVTFGVAPLLFVQVLYGQFFYASSILMAAFWLGVIPLLLTAYYAAYLYDFRFASLGKVGAAVVGLAFLLFLGIAFLYTNNMTLMLDPRRWQAYFANPRGTILNLGDPTLIPRYLHFVVGGIAIGGLFVALFGKIREKKDPRVGELAGRLGMRLFLSFTLAQIAVGIWFLARLPREVVLHFLGGNAVATLVSLAGLLLAAFVLLAGYKGKLVPTAVLTVALVYLMTFLRDFVRTGYLAPMFSPDRLTVVPQYGPMVLFAGTLVAGLAVLAWMIVQTRDAFAGPRGSPVNPPERRKPWRRNRSLPENGAESVSSP